MEPNEIAKEQDTKKYGPMEPPSDLKMVGTPVTEEEIAYPNADDLPTDEPIARYTGGSSNVGLSRFIKFMRDLPPDKSTTTRSRYPQRSSRRT